MVLGEFVDALGQVPGLSVLLAGHGGGQVVGAGDLDHVAGEGETGDSILGLRLRGGGGLRRNGRGRLRCGLVRGQGGGR